MQAEEILNSEDFKRCAAFHGHICPGLSIGYRAAKAAMAKLKEERAGDEELAAIVETDACSADAVQVITGCTFGKGNFIYRDYGKMALTLFSRNSGEGVRLIARPASVAPDGEHRALLQKIMDGEATEDEQNRFQELHRARARNILEKPVEELFDFTKVNEELPPRARMEPSEICPQCGEPAMPAKMEVVNGKKICRGCAGC